MKTEKMDTEDKKLFEEMCLEYGVYLGRIAYINDIPVDYVEDVVQDTFVSCVRCKYSLDMPEGSKGALLIRIPRSRCMDFHRRMKYRSYGKPGERAYNSEDYPVHDRATDLPGYVISKGRCQVLPEEVERMPENWRQAATLRLIGGWPTRGVYVILNTIEETCYSRVNHIKKYLEELLKSGNWP